MPARTVAAPDPVPPVAPPPEVAQPVTGANSAPADTLPATATATATAEAPLVPPAVHPAWGSQPPTVYPAVSRRLGEQGEVVLRLYVLADGRIGDVVIQQSSGHPRLDRAAVEAARRWRLLPARRGDNAVALWHEWPVHFRLQ